MKIEIGESLMMSYLKHIKKCVFYQTNWKTSSNWDITTEDFNKIQNIYNKIINHSEFAGIFKKSGLKQLIQQSEIDVLGMDSNNVIYAVDIAFHEKGLNYGDKIETKDRILKKMLRSYLVLLSYFPNRKYELLFCSPKVNPAYEKIILKYVQVLNRDFTDENVNFIYFTNEKFFENILFPILSKTTNDSDTNELFMRSIILYNMFKKDEMRSANIPMSKKTLSENTYTCGDELILEFNPSDERIFLQDLVKTKKAKRTIFYKNKSPKTEIWNAKKITTKSNLRNNICTNNIFRQWKRLEITKIRFEIID
jgi:hypothetical protein